MVTQNGIDSTIVKAKFGSDIRKTEIHHTQDLNYNDLVLMMQRFFQIKPSTNVSLKYRDSENDWITLANDDDVSFALRHETNLYVKVLIEENLTHPTSPIISDSILSAQNIGKDDDEEQKSVTSQLIKLPPPQQSFAQNISINDVSPQQQHYPAHAPLENPQSLPSNNAPQLQQLFSATPPLQQQPANQQQQQQTKSSLEMNNHPSQQQQQQQQQQKQPSDTPQVLLQHTPQQQQYCSFDTSSNSQLTSHQPPMFPGTPTFLPQQQPQQPHVQKPMELFSQQQPLTPLMQTQSSEPPHAQPIHSNSQTPFPIQHHSMPPNQLQAAAPQHPPGQFPPHQHQSFPPSSIAGFAPPPSSIGEPMNYSYQATGNGCVPPPSLAGGQPSMQKSNAANPFARGMQPGGRPAGGYFQ